MRNSHNMSGITRTWRTLANSSRHVLRSPNNKVLVSTRCYAKVKPFAPSHEDEIAIIKANLEEDDELKPQFLPSFNGFPGESPLDADKPQKEPVVKNESAEEKEVRVNEI